MAYWRQERSVALHLVNMTNPMAMRGAFRELIPCPEQQVEIVLPQGGEVERVKLLTSGLEPSFTLRDGVLAVTVPGFALHEVVAVDLK